MENLTGLFVVLGIVWFIIALIIGNFGKTRAIGFAGAFYASLLLSPILAMLFVLASKERTYTGLNSGEKIALFLPIGLILFFGVIIGGFVAIENAKWEKGYAEIMKKKEFEDSLKIELLNGKMISATMQQTLLALPLSTLQEMELSLSEPKKFEMPVTEPSNGIWVKYNSNKSITLESVYDVTIPSSQIPALIKIFEKADKLANYCDSINSVKIKKHIGTVNGTNFYFERSGWGRNEINFGEYGSISCGNSVKLLTTERDLYYEQLKAYQEKKKKDEELLSKF